jgi:ankyrin repeat protein
MKNAPLVFGLVTIASCTSNIAPQSAAAPTPAPAPGPSQTDTDGFFAAIRAADDDAALALLAKFPALAVAHTPKGASAYRAALGRVVNNGFIRPQDNRAAKAILALHPPLDAFEAAAAGDVARVEREIAGDASYVKRVHESGWTPLHFAAFGGEPRVVELLLAHGAEIDAVAKNQFANTPLLVSLLTRQGDIARLLVAHGADVRFQMAEGFTALHEAALDGDLDTVRMLLDAGADPNVRSETGGDGGGPGVTPVEMAAKHGFDAVVALLKERGAK